MTLTTLDLKIARLAYLGDRMTARSTTHCPLYDSRRASRWMTTLIKWKRDRFRLDLPEGRGKGTAKMWP